MATQDHETPNGEEGAPTTFYDSLPLPKILVFDLDYTLWSFWIDTHVLPPLKPKDGGKRAVDSTGEAFAFYREVSGILAAAHARSIPLGLASRTCTPDLAESLLKMLKVPVTGTDKKAGSTRAFDLFRYKQIYPGDKRTHLKRISKSSGIDCEDILFFDDESRNRNVESLGVCFWLVRDGVTRSVVDEGIREWRRRRHGISQSR